MKYELIAPCLFGMESTVSFELKNLGIKVLKVSDGRVTFEGDEFTIAKANLSLRTAERVLVKVGEFKAYSFEDLYQGMLSLPFEKYIEKDSAFPVAKAKTIKSKLFSVPDIQSVAKKGVVERLKLKHRVTELPETKEIHPINIFINKDVVEVTIDTTGPALHKRGYREKSGGAPIRETLAAFMVMLTPWRPGRYLVDPMCGSGTILIEAALIGANIMPGINRNFTGENLSFIPKRVWKEEREEALRLENDVDFKIKGYDIDEEVIEIAKENAEIAGVGHLIDFEVRDIKDFEETEEYGFIITNPPYGERLGSEDEINEIYNILKENFKKLKNWSYYIITTMEDLESTLEIPFQKNRKLYNGMLKSYYYQYLGPKPPKK
ncbi:putative N6-adenine-specific DNA methylase [Acetoanaerobium pronyense]|uniref:N6-adenine-specific DNA methylase n=1 Tax=Acetoanaerobium pronyense TaxID=1482736 RepID=A0ABS4KG93_9FIRM|nr:class I SAM-dependent RNA methyltransferase [Acetoanaerobium pronyense]MBP2026385.1 putative N6-adenine-specific DNA methylase [Acetoanaerobium pronyense]